MMTREPGAKITQEAPDSAAKMSIPDAIHNPSKMNMLINIPAKKMCLPNILRPSNALI
jgi:hypothetical protein